MVNGLGRAPTFSSASQLAAPRVPPPGFGVAALVGLSIGALSALLGLIGAPAVAGAAVSLGGLPSYSREHPCI